MWWKDGVKETMNKYNDELLEAVSEIAGLIYYQTDLKEQERWSQKMMDSGLWSPDDGC